MKKSGVKPCLGFLGPHLGARPGWVVTQSEILARLFTDEGYEVQTSSSVAQPILRAADMLRACARWRGRVDVVVLSVFSGRAFHIADVVSRAARLFSLPQIHVLRGGALPELAAEQPRRVRQVLSRADAIVSPSAFLARTTDELGLEADVIPNVLDLGAYEYQPRPLSNGGPVEMLWLRTFHPIYRPLTALKTVAELRRRGVDARLTFAGQDKGLEDTCRRGAEELGLASSVRFAGFLDAEGKRRELARHDLYLHTNQVDNTPVTVLEAAASGLPIVATGVGGLPDLIDDGRSGLLVQDAPDGELARQLADAVQRLLDEPSLAPTLSRGGRELAERCAWPRVHEQWRELFARVLE